MNCTKIIPPLPGLISFYYNYSSFMLFLCLLITPLQFYIILTKSQKLKSLKWLILNHSFWSLLFEVVFSLIKPMLLSPALASYPLGIIRNGSSYISSITLFFGALIGVTFSSSLSITIMSRYLYAFPTNFTQCLNKKYFYLFYFLFILSIYINGTLLGINYFFATDPSNFRQAAIKYDPCLQIFMDEEPGFLFTPVTNSVHSAFLFLVIMFVGDNILAVVIATYFIYIVKSQKSQTLEKLQRSLIISAIVQISITESLLHIPLQIGVFVVFFEFFHMENIIIILACIVFSHSFFESLTTLYFVTPYRKGIIDIMKKIFPSLNCLFPKSIVISPIAQTEISLNLSRVAVRHS